MNAISDKNRRLYFDVTGLRDYFKYAGSISGIQRVELMIIREAIRLIGGDRVFLFYYDDGQGKHLAHDCRDLTSADQFSINDTDAIKSQIGFVHQPPSLGPFIKSPIRRLMLRWEIALNAMAENNDYFRAFGTTASEWRETKSRYKSLRKVAFKPVVGSLPNGSVVLIPSFVASSVNRFDSLKKIIAEKCDLVTIFYDIIPRRFPAIDPAGVFETFFDCLASRITCYMAISKSAASDLKDLLSEMGTVGRIEHVPLARQKLILSGVREPKNQRALPEEPYVLCVGSFESRKANLNLALAWQTLAHEIPNLPRLIYAGRPGLETAPFFQFLEVTDNLSGKIELFKSPTDAELVRLYKNCLFTSFISTFEGWGLPVGESIAYGKTGVTSTTTSLPEVAEDLMLYADPFDVSTIVDAMRRLLTEPGLRESLEAKIATRKLRTWEEVAQDMLAVAFGLDRPQPIQHQSA
jgi:glycosyltransferase involved in cell wall biosynthesis